jgi:nucleoside-diphosphate-sugar epimerase
MRVFLTGAAGFIGSHVARVLIAAGCEVTALVRPTSNLWRLPDLLDRLTLAEADLEDAAALRQILARSRPEACIHLAWYVEPGKYLPAIQNLSCLTASLTLLKELAKVECKKVVMAGTCAEYDTELGYLREYGPTKPATVYASTKLALCLVGQQFAALHGLQFAWGRVFYLYGPQEDERRVLPALFRALSKGEPFPATLGEQVRDYLHVEDVATAFWTLAREGASGIFNIASGIPITMRQLMETLGDVVGRRDLIRFGAVPYRTWEPPFVCGDNRRLRFNGWSPRYSLQDGLQATFKPAQQQA